MGGKGGDMHWHSARVPPAMCEAVLLSGMGMKHPTGRRGGTAPRPGTQLCPSRAWAVALWLEGRVPGDVLRVPVLLYGKLFSDCE